MDKLYELSEIEDRRQKQLGHLCHLCCICTQCHLGRSLHDHKHYRFDPHVFSNLNISKWMVVGQNPGFRECINGEPFVGPAGKNFDDEIAKHGLTRAHFYITNVVKCHTANNDAKLVDAAIPRCSPFLTMEINILRPRLIITLGAYSFKFLSGEKYSESLGNIVRSDELELDIFPIYHPSPLNLNVKERREAYEQQIADLCALIKMVDKIT